VDSIWRKSLSHWAESNPTRTMQNAMAKIALKLFVSSVLTCSNLCSVIPAIKRENTKCKIVIGVVISELIASSELKLP